MGRLFFWMNKSTRVGVGLILCAILLVLIGFYQTFEEKIRL